MGELLNPESKVKVQCEAIEQSEPQIDDIKVVTASLPPEDSQLNRATDFHAVATTAFYRGFKYLTPLRPDTKTPILRGYTKRAPTTPEQIKLWARQFPNYGVGIVCRHGVGTTMVFDDDTGVAEQIEKDTGKKIPDTYVVSSRPETAPWKRHFYFTQTEYSRKHLPKTINANTVGGRYDVKITGQVVAAGTIHSKTGKPYVATGDAPEFPIGVPVPEWLVDWFVADKEFYRQQRLQAKNAKGATSKIEPIEIQTAEQIERAEQLKLCKRERVERQLLSSTDLVPVGERHTVWWQKATAWAATNMPRRIIKTGLLAYSEDHFYDGMNFARENYQYAHNCAYSSKLRFGNTWIGEKKETAPVVTEAAPSRHRLLVEVALQFPDGITVDERYERFARALEGTEWTALNRHLPEDKKAIYDVRVEADYETRGYGRHSKWYKRRVTSPDGRVTVTSAVGKVTISGGKEREKTTKNKGSS